MKNIFDQIKLRRSNRYFCNKKVADENIFKLIEAATWAPSSKNSQPWRFIVIKQDYELKKKISKLTIYDNIINNASCLIIVFLDKCNSNELVKDIQAIGAAIQNILLAAQDMKLGTCWIGEILKNEDDIKQIFNIDESMNLMAVIAIGYPKIANIISERKKVNDFILSWN